MQCNDVKEILWLCESGEADSGTRSRAEAHLKTCPSCSAESAALERIIGALPRPPRLSEAYWDSYNQKILDRLEKKAPARPVSAWRWAPVMAAAIFLAGGGAVYRHYQEKNKIEEIVEHLEVLDNLEILEREDFEKLIHERL